jgi:hypothetical protein
MKRPTVLSAAAAALMMAVVGAWSYGNQARTAAGPAPAVAALSDREFWRLSSSFSEPDGTFHSENLVSNESTFQSVLPELATTAKAGRAYVGVGSEQNFTYITTVRPSIGFIVDIRRGNLDLHLLYKAFFELSADRAEFVSRLFARPRPAGLNAKSTAFEIFTAFQSARPSETLYAENLRAAYAVLGSKHGFPLSEADKEGMEFVYRAWFTSGPDIRYELTNGFGFGGRRGPGGFPSYADLMTATDDSGRARSYLASEENFTLIKTLETRNLLVPVVGNFGGLKALKSIAGYLKSRGLVVSAFYVSNVEQYLRQNGIWEQFCGNAHTLPVDRTSVFIRSSRGGFAGQGGGPPRGFGGFGLTLSPIADDVAACAAR